MTFEHISAPMGRVIEKMAKAHEELMSTVAKDRYDALREDRDYWKERARQEKLERERIASELANERRFHMAEKQRIARQQLFWGR